MKLKHTLEIVICIGLIWLLVLNYLPVKWDNIKDKPVDNGKYDYCLRWGQVEAVTLPWLCYDQAKDKWNCGWQVTPTNSILIFDAQNQSKILSEINCTLFAKTLYVPQ